MLFSFTLNPEDPNYEMYADHINADVEASERIRYYVKIADELKIEEKRTMYVDFTHMTSFQWEDSTFIDRLQSEYVRFEPYLRQALT